MVISVNNQTIITAFIYTFSIGKIMLFHETDKPNTTLIERLYDEVN